MSGLQFIAVCKLGSNVRSSHCGWKQADVVKRCAKPPVFQGLIDDSYEPRHFGWCAGTAPYIALRAFGEAGSFILMETRILVADRNPVSGSLQRQRLQESRRIHHS